MKPAPPDHRENALTDTQDFQNFLDHNRCHWILLKRPCLQKKGIAKFQHDKDSMSSSDLGAKSSYIIQFRIHCIDECLAIQDLRGSFTGLQSVQVALPPLAHVVKAMSQPLFFKSIETFLAQKKGLSASVKTKQNKKTKTVSTNVTLARWQQQNGNK